MADFWRDRARGNVDFVAGRLGDAASGYRAALTRRPGWSAARKNLALTLEASGDTVGARDLWSGLLDDPELRGEARIRLAALEPAR